MKAIGYFRETKSSAKGDSLAAQNKDFLKFCEDHGYEVAVTFVEIADGNGSNGGGNESSRGGFRQLVDYLRRTDRGFVLVVARSFEGMGVDRQQAVRRYFQLEGLGAQVTFMAGPSDPLAELVESRTEQEGERLGDRVRAAMRRKAVRGEVLGRPPYGYRVGSRRRLELVPDEAVVVRYIFRMYLHEDMGIRLIARRLNEEGFHTRRGGNWSMVSIRDILRNRVYLGTYSRFGVRVPGSHPALVSPDDFRAVQDRLSARRNNYAPRKPSPFLLAGLVRCGHCGNKMIGVSRKQSWRRRSGTKGQASYRYYQCESRTNQSMCDYHTQRAGELEGEVRDQLAELDEDALLPRAGDGAAVKAELEAKAERLETRLHQLDRRLDDQLGSAAKGRITREQLHKLNVATATNQLRLEEELEEIQRHLQDQQNASERARTRKRSLASLLDGWETLSLAEKQPLLRDLVDHVAVRDDGVQVILRP
ncbi:MAG: recombinase family protein [Chloroflexi bacterium]|nr:recombinase family protein [Chloroflexota bacterium]